jgi:glycosyltransferase involved in cell wall biosynthesis
MLKSIQEAMAHLQTMEWALLSLFILIFLLRTIYLILFTGKVAFFKIQPGGQQSPLSLILPVRNEEENLRKNLSRVLAIDNTEFEVMAVDDFSQDNSLPFLTALKEQDSRIGVSALSQETRYSEKMARNIALKASRYNWVMVIPPSATGFSPSWLADIAARLDDNSEVVVNYSNAKANGTFFNLLFRVESFFQQIKSYEFTLNGLPFVVSEENVAFQKQKYFEAGGYHGKITEPFANLELVINSFIRKSATRLLLSNKTIVQKDENSSKNRFKELLVKELRLKKNLSFIKRFWLTFLNWLNLLLLPVSACTLFFLPFLLPVIITSLVVFTLGYALIIKKILSRLDERKLFLPSLLFALLLPYLKLFFRTSYSDYGREKRWKGKK